MVEGWAYRARLFWEWIAVEIRQLIYEYKTVLKYENQSVCELDSSHAVLIWCLSRNVSINRLLDFESGLFWSGRVWQAPLFSGLLFAWIALPGAWTLHRHLRCWEKD